MISARLSSPSSAWTSSAERDHPGHGGRDQQQLAPVDRVGDRTAPQPEHDQRHQPDQAEHADPERRQGDRVHLHRHGHRGDLEPDERDALADEQPAVVGVSQRPGVDRDRAQVARPRHGASRSTTQAAGRQPVAQPVVQPAGRPCQNSTASGATRNPPQLGRRRHLVRVAGGERGDRAPPARPGTRPPPTAGWPPRPAGTAARPRSQVGGRLRPRPTRAARPGDDHLPLGGPGEDQRDRRVRGELPALAGAVVGEEHEAALADTPLSSTVRADGRPPGSRSRRPSRSARRPARTSTTSSNQRRELPHPVRQPGPASGQVPPGRTCGARHGHRAEDRAPGRFSPSAGAGRRPADRQA